MSALGKIFSIVVILAAAVSFGINATLYMRRSDYRQAYASLQEEMQKMSQQDIEQILTLRKQNDTNLTEIEANRAVVTQMRQAVQSLTSRFEAQTLELAQRNAWVGTLLEAHKTVAEELGQKESQIDNLQTNLEQAKEERDKAYEEKETAEEQLAVMVARSADLDKDNHDLKVLLASLQEDLNASEATLALLREKYDIGLLVADLPAPAIDAKVSNVSNQTTPALCVLSVGDEDGVKPGFTFTVYRGTEFVGRVLVERVQDDLSFCRVLFTKDGSQIQINDSATTR